MSMKGLKVTAEKGKGSNPSVRHTTSAGVRVNVPGTSAGQGSGKKSPGMTKEASRGLGVKR